jgi:hypothetical protein
LKKRINSGVVKEREEGEGEKELEKINGAIRSWRYKETKRGWGGK